MPIPDLGSMSLDLSSKAMQEASPAQIALVNDLCRKNSGLIRPEMTRTAVSRWLDDVLERPEPDDLTDRTEDLSPEDSYWSDNIG